MQPTGIEDQFIIKQNKRLRLGYTTGTCAAAAAHAAARMLLSGMEVHSVRIMTPAGICLDLPVEDITRESILDKGERVSCAVRKDAGDDPDVTDGILVYAAAAKSPEKGIRIDGGIGVGRVTRPGMSRKIGEAAINPVPLRMIREEAEKVCEDWGYDGGLDVVISIPEGVKLAARTFNPRLGIEGGISVLGTSGIVVPMSERALVESIRLEMKMLLESGHDYLVVTPGNYGETFSRENLSLDLSSSLKCSNFVGETLDMAVEMGVKGILFVAHIGKFIKVAGGIMNTHSKEADCRAELMAAFALRSGADVSCVNRILETATTDEALAIMDEAGIRQQAMDLAAKKIRFYLHARTGGAIETEAVLFSGSYGYLAQTERAEEMMVRFAGHNEEFRKEESPGRAEEDR